MDYRPVDLEKLTEEEWGKAIVRYNDIVSVANHYRAERDILRDRLEEIRHLTLRLYEEHMTRYGKDILYLPNDILEDLVEAVTEGSVDRQVRQIIYD